MAENEKINEAEKAEQITAPVSEEEIEKVSGGAGSLQFCPRCRKSTYNRTMGMCTSCGYPRVW